MFSFKYWFFFLNILPITHTSLDNWILWLFPIPPLCPDSNKFLVKDRQRCENSIGRSMRGIVGERQVGEGSRKCEKWCWDRQKWACLFWVTQEEGVEQGRDVSRDPCLHRLKEEGQTGHRALSPRLSHIVTSITLPPWWLCIFTPTPVSSPRRCSASRQS